MRKSNNNFVLLGLGCECCGFRIEPEKLFKKKGVRPATEKELLMWKELNPPIKEDVYIWALGSEEFNDRSIPFYPVINSEYETTDRKNLTWRIGNCAQGVGGAFESYYLVVPEVKCPDNKTFNFGNVL